MSAVGCGKIVPAKVINKKKGLAGLAEGGET